MWDLKIEVDAYLYLPREGAFHYPEETYHNWMWMALDSGRFSFQIGKGPSKVTGECGPGDWMLCPPHQFHRRFLIQDLNLHYIRFRCQNPTLLLSMIGKGTLQDGQFLRSRLNSLLPAMDQPDGAQWVAHVLRDLIISWHWEQRSIQRQLVDPVLESCREYLDRHAPEDVDLAQLAARHRMAAGTFSRRFKAAYGQPPSQYLLARRLTPARSLLLETKLSLDSIARATGFGSGLYLSRVWRQKHGETPGLYRRQHRV